MAEYIKAVETEDEERRRAIMEAILLYNREDLEAAVCGCPDNGAEGEQERQPRKRVQDSARRRPGNRERPVGATADARQPSGQTVTRARVYQGGSVMNRNSFR